MNQSEGMRINKFLSAAGVCSRREADRLIAAGKVTVAGETAELGTLVSAGMEVKVNGRRVGAVEELASKKKVLLAVNKPVGVVCTTTDNDRAPNIVELIDYPERVYPIGRLDKDSEGLLLLTNQGELVNQILRCENGHEKEYIVRVDKALTPRRAPRGTAGHDAALQSRGARQDELFDCSDAGLKPADSPHVRGLRLSCDQLKAHPHHEYLPPQSPQRRVPECDGGRAEDLVVPA